MRGQQVVGRRLAASGTTAWALAQGHNHLPAPPSPLLRLARLVAV